MASRPRPSVAAVPSDGVEERLADDALVAGGVGGHAPPVGVNLGDPLAEAEDHVPLAHVVHEGLDDLFVNELEDALTLVHDCHLNTKSGEDAGELDADDPGSDHGEGSGDLLEAVDAVGVDDGGSVDGDGLRVGRPAAHGDNDVICLDFEVSLGLATARTWGSRKEASPRMTSTRFLLNWSWMTWLSREMTSLQRRERSPMVRARLAAASIP